MILTKSKLRFIFIWQLDWGIEDDEKVRRYYYSKMATCHRKWRTEMTKLWLNGETPDFKKLQMEEKDWDEFIESRMTQDFDVCLFLCTFISN
jgi:hypothetical protein